MADASTDPKPDAVANSEPATTETEPATNPDNGDASKEEAAPDAVCMVSPSGLC